MPSWARISGREGVTDQWNVVAACSVTAIGWLRVSAATEGTFPAQCVNELQTY